MKLRALARSLVSAYMVVAALMFAGLVGTALVLWKQGVFDAETVQKLGKVLRRQPVGEEVKVEVPPEEFARDIDRMKLKAQEDIDRKLRDLERQESEFKLVHEKLLEDRAAALETKEADVAAREAAFETQIADREAAVRADELARSSKNFKLDLDLLSRLDAKDAAAMLKEWYAQQPDRVILLIRSLRSRVAGDIFAELLKIEPGGKDVALKIQQNLTEGPGLSPSELRRLAARLAEWEENDLVALLRQVEPPEREAFVREIQSGNDALGRKLRERLAIGQ